MLRAIDFGSEEAYLEAVNEVNGFGGGQVFDADWLAAETDSWPGDRLDEEFGPWQLDEEEFPVDPRIVEHEKEMRAKLDAGLLTEKDLKIPF